MLIFIKGGKIMKSKEQIKGEIKSSQHIINYYEMLIRTNSTPYSSEETKDFIVELKQKINLLKWVLEE